jgi:hypothetical protein
MTRSAGPDTAVRRAGLLLACYPRAWRARYGAEFLDLLTADLAEQPHSWRRTADVVGHGLLARLTITGRAGGVLDPVDQVRAGLTAVGWASAAFLTFGVAMWSQVVIGWRWEPPATPAVTAGMLAMSGAALLAAVVLLVGTAPVACSLLRAVHQRQAQGFLRPTLLVGVGATVLLVGGLHFDAHWPGTGGHPWAHHGLVPSGVAAFGWAATRGVTSYWFHPAALARFDAVEIAWMATSLAAIVICCVGLTKIVRRVQLTPRALRFETVVARGALVVMMLFVAGAATWVIADDPAGPTGIYQVGAIDVVGLAVMAVALMASGRALARTRVSGRWMG